LRSLSSELLVRFGHFVVLFEAFLVGLLAAFGKAKEFVDLPVVVGKGTFYWLGICLACCFGLLLTCCFGHLFGLLFWAFIDLLFWVFDWPAVLGICLACCFGLLIDPLFWA
jgi:hypothetical protein